MDVHRTTGETDAPAFRIDVVNLCVWRRNGAAVDERLDLAPKTFDVLRYLVENAGRLITHDELLTALWRGIHVQPEVLKSHILAIRNALGDKRSSPRFIETHRGRGYRFIGPINGFTSVPEAPAIVAERGSLAGRAEPMRTLQDLVKRAAAGERQAVFVSGEPGIGKSALVQALVGHARHIPGLLVAQGNCIEGFGGIEPYYPVLEALGGLCSLPSKAATIRGLVTVAPAWAAQMVELRAEQREIPPMPIDVARSRMVREGTNLFEALAAERPLLLILEDLHWADYATVDLLSALCRRRSASKLMLVVTYRSEELGSARHPLRQMAHELAARKYCREIELGPLPRRAIAELLAGGPDGVPTSDAFIAFIEEWSGGNPLFIELILEFLQQHGLAEQADRRWQPLAAISEPAFATPPTLQRILESKIDGMPDEARRVLEAASVMGLRFDTTTAAPAADMDELSFEAICEAFSRNSCTVRRDGLVRLPDGDLVQGYAFRHAVFRQVIYDGLGQSRRTLLHRRIGERLEATYPPGQRSDLAIPLARHFAAARDWTRALDYLRAALRVANSRLARRDALAIIDHASSLAAHLSDHARVPAELEFLERRAALLAAAHDPLAHEAYMRLAELARLHGDIDARCRALLGLAYVMSWRDLGDSRPILDEVLALSKQQSDPVQRDVTQIAAYARRTWGFGWNKADAARCEAALKQLKERGDSLAIARGQIGFSMVCMVSTRYREAHDLVDGSYEVLRDSPDNLVEVDLARAVWMRHIGVPWSLFSRGAFGAALNEFDASIAVFEKEDDRAAVLSYQVYRGILRFHAFDFEGTLRDCEPIASLAAEAAAPAIRILPVNRRIALIFRGLAEVGLGNHAKALAAFRVAEGEMETRQVHLDWYWRLALEWGMVSLLIAMGDHDGAATRADGFCALAEQTDERAWQALAYDGQARAALACGDLTKATDHVDKALAACAGVQVPNAELRVLATSAMTFRAAGDAARAALSTSRGEIIRKLLAESLPEGHALRQQFERCSASLFTG